MKHPKSFLAVFGLSALALVILLTRPDASDLFTIDEPRIGDDPFYGAEDAALTVVLFGDFESDGTRDAVESLRDIVDANDDIRLVWKDFPNASLHPDAVKAAVAAQCAHRQDVFWEYAAYLLDNQNAFGDDLYYTVGDTLELRARAFANCVENDETLELIDESYREGLALKILSTPTIYIGSERFAGEMTDRDIALFIDEQRP